MDIFSAHQRLRPGVGTQKTNQTVGSSEELCRECKNSKLRTFAFGGSLGVQGDAAQSTFQAGAYCFSGWHACFNC